jgi:hypothetical protein
MKDKHHRRGLPRQNRQSDQWEAPVLYKHLASTSARRIINLARQCTPPEPPEAPRTGPAPGFRPRRHRTF